ncbi:hypothetical protein BGZ83_003795 [Gryganskiella cystojenkinii]|nr:hypothetical protein BGZ83_003795 [Gryganskiella cystojenkinii]
MRTTPIRGSPALSERRKLASMHRYRLLRDVKRMKRATPQQSALLDIGGVGGGQSKKSIKKSRLQQRRRVAHAQAGYESAYVLDAYGRLLPRYDHVHYHYKRRYRSRIRFLGFQHFLMHSRLASPKGKMVIKREQEKKLRYLDQIRTGDPKKNSNTDQFMSVYGRAAMYLSRAIEKDDPRKAIRTAKTMIKVRGGGSAMPNGNQCRKLIEMDESLLVASRTGIQELQFTTVECNVILSRCAELKDWRNGLRITNILMSRYTSPHFDFANSSLAIPNTATADLMATHYLRSNRPDAALKMFQNLRRRLSSPLSTDVYTRFLHQLSDMPDSIPWIQKTLEHLRKDGPAPSVTNYNMLVRATATQKRSRHADNILKEMESRGIQPDQQTFRLLIQGALQDLKVSKAHFWLGEYKRHGFEIVPRMMDPFMKTCVEYSTASRKYLESISHEWMTKALHVMQFMSREGLRPTAYSYEYLIQGFLSQGKIREARAAMDLMRNDTHMYTPTKKTWMLLFDHYLSVGDDVSAIDALNEMRRERTTGWGAKVNEAVATVSRLPYHVNAVPTRMYHQLFRHLLDHNKVSKAERSVYEMLLRQKLARPRTREVVDLIWQLGRFPDSAERVYELLYSQTEYQDASGQRGTRRHGLLNRIVVQGPIQMANVGVIRAKAISGDRELHVEAWNAWREMTSRFENQSKIKGLNVSRVDEERRVLAIAFEEVVKALRHTGPKEKQFQESLKKAQLKTDGKRSNGMNTDSWDFTPFLRAYDSAGSNSRSKKYQAVVRDHRGKPILDKVPSQTVRAHLEAETKHRTLLRQLMEHHAFVAPLTQRFDSKWRIQNSKSRDDNSSSPRSTDLEAREEEKEQESRRLKQLQDCLSWVDRNGIPIQIQGFNSYLQSLVSHRANFSLEDAVERFLLRRPQKTSSSSNSSSSLLRSSKPRLIADLKTLQILTGKNLKKVEPVQGGEKLAERVLSAVTSSSSAPLREEWFRFLESEKAKESSSSLVLESPSNS